MNMVFKIWEFKKYDLGSRITNNTIVVIKTYLFVLVWNAILIIWFAQLVKANICIVLIPYVVFLGILYGLKYKEMIIVYFCIDLGSNDMVFPIWFMIAPSICQRSY